MSRQLAHSYVDAAWLPRDLPSPQCGVEFSVASGQNHRPLADSVALQLALATGKLGKDRLAGLSRWDVRQADGTTFRLFLDTRAAQSGTAVSRRMLNLRD